MKSNKLGIFEQYKLLFNGTQEDLVKIPSSSFFVLINWLSYNKNNLDICQKLNRYYKYVNTDVLKYLLYWKLDTEGKYIKFIKSIKGEKLDFLKDYIKKYFSYSEREFILMKPVFDKLLNDNDFKQILNITFGFSESECKKLDIQYKKDIKKRSDSISLFSFAK